MRRASLSAAPLVASDLVALQAGFLLVWALSSGSAPGLTGSALLLMMPLSVGLVAANSVFGLYPGTGLHSVDEMRQSVLAASLLFGLFMLAALGGGRAMIPSLLAAGVVSVVTIPALRWLTRSVCSRSRWWLQPLLVLGDGPDGRRIAEYFAQNPALGLVPVPSDEGGTSHTAWAVEPAGRQTEAIRSLALRHDAYWAAIPLAEKSGPTERKVVRSCMHIFPRVLLLPGEGDLPSLRARATGWRDVAGIEVGAGLLLPLPRVFKRCLDVGAALVGAVVVLPLGALIAIAIKLTSPGPVLYASERIGHRRSTFRAWKFRTMYVDADRVLHDHLAADESLHEEWTRTNKLKNDPRMTPVGRLLRRMSLDELPQLFNVLVGHMSLVGPRPIVPDELGRRKGELGPYLSVLPGITGLWQISGRSTTTYEERVRLDNFYVHNWSVWLDLFIMTRTFRVVFTGHGAY